MMMSRRLSVGFRKPPVVEAWIEFKFALTQERSAWDEDAAKRLVKNCFEDLTPESFSMYARIEMDGKIGRPNVADIQAVFDRIRAFSNERDRCIQAGRDVFVFNQLNTGKWPGYEAMRDGALEAVAKYMGFRELDELTAIALHYRDIVSVPKAQDSGIKLEDWFQVYPEVSGEAFGRMSAFTFSVQLPEMCTGATAVLRLGSLPLAGEGDSEFRFSIDWHVSSTDRVEDLEAAKQWLDSAHAAFRSSFDKAFTPKCLATFEPDTGE
jgi:uncharacterized protein (TIGR04255 family)